MQRTSDINVVETRPLPSPAALIAEVPKSEAQADFVTRSRQDIHRLIFTDDRRLLLIVGPCSIHDVDAGREYARRLAALRPHAWTFSSPAHGQSPQHSPVPAT